MYAARYCVLQRSIISAILQLLIHRLIGISYSFFKAATIAFKVTVQPFGFDEELNRLPILHALVQVFEQRFLFVVWT